MITAERLITIADAMEFRRFFSRGSPVHHGQAAQRLEGRLRPAHGRRRESVLSQRR